MVGKLVLVLFVVLVGVAIVGASMGFNTDGQGSNPINDATKCAYNVQTQGGSILDVVRVCNPLDAK